MLMPDEIPTNVVEQHERRHGRTIIDLTRQCDGAWTATQHEDNVVGTGETPPSAVIDYCQQLAADTNESER